MNSAARASSKKGEPTFWGTSIEAAWVTYDDISFLSDELELHDQLEHLKEDLLQVELPNSLIIDVGWLPSFDPNGAFHITVVSDGDWEHPRWQAQADDVAALKPMLSSLVEECLAGAIGELSEHPS